MTTKHPRLARLGKDAYRLIDTHYKSDNFAKGRAFKAFFDEFCKNVFETNLAMLQDLELFPIAYSENNAYASIAHALHLLTPYAWSEAYINYKDKKSENSGESKAQSKDKWRFVDFWCMDEKKEFELWIEAKRLWLNIGKNSQWDFDSEACRRIKKGKNDKENGALDQIYNINDAKPEQSADTSFKIALFTIPVSCAISQISEESDIKNAPKIVADLLATFIDKRRNMGILCGVLNLDSNFTLKDKILQGKVQEGQIYASEYTPYAILAAVVLGC